MKREFYVGDKVICTMSGVVGVVEKFYFPTACAEQTMVITPDGRRYHAPTSEWIRFQEQVGLNTSFIKEYKDGDMLNALVLLARESGRSGTIHGR